MHPADNRRIDYRNSHLGSAKAREYDRDFWSDSSAKGLDWALERRLLEQVFTHSLVAPPRRALDFACGTGRVLAELELRVAETVGIDVSEAMLDIARVRCRSSQLIRADVTSADAVLDLGGPIDLATSFRFFLNAEPELRTAALHWIRSVLEPDGRLVVNFHLNPASLRGRYLRARWRGESREAMLSPTEADRLLRANGFEVVECLGYEFLPYRRDGARLLAPRLRARVESALVGRPSLLQWAGCFLVVARPA